MQNLKSLDCSWEHFMDCSWGFQDCSCIFISPLEVKMGAFRGEWIFARGMNWQIYSPTELKINKCRKWSEFGDDDTPSLLYPAKEILRSDPGCVQQERPDSNQDVMACLECHWSSICERAPQCFEVLLAPTALKSFSSCVFHKLITSSTPCCRTLQMRKRRDHLPFTGIYGERGISRWGGLLPMPSLKASQCCVSIKQPASLHPSCDTMFLHVFTYMNLPRDFWNISFNTHPHVFGRPSCGPRGGQVSRPKLKYF